MFSEEGYEGIKLSDEDAVFAMTREGDRIQVEAYANQDLEPAPTH